MLYIYSAFVLKQVKILAHVDSLLMRAVVFLRALIFLRALVFSRAVIFKSAVIMILRPAAVGGGEWWGGGAVTSVIAVDSDIEEAVAAVAPHQEAGEHRLGVGGR